MITVIGRLRGRAVLAAAGLALLLAVPAAAKDVYVRGYTKDNGTYVAPHYRSAPDGNPTNNYSYPGNVNPHTGKVAPSGSSPRSGGLRDTTSTYPSAVPPLQNNRQLESFKRY